MMAASPHPRDAEAFEHVVGTGSRSERESFAREIERDAQLAQAVRFWEERLSGLAEAVPPAVPSPGLFDEIAGKLHTSDVRQGGQVVDLAELRRLRRSRTLWRSVAAAAGSIAAALAIFIAVERGGAPAGEGGLVAVVNRSGDLPALIVRVDQRAGVVQIRSVAAEAPPDRSLELWSIAPGAAPRSLGLVGPGTTRVNLSGAAGSISSDVTLAVTVEPPGGAPGGVATGPVVYTGRLIPER
jgi:anti-sigma-K factor RskA